MTYRYERFERVLVKHDLAFEAGPRPGDPMPDFDLPTVEGGRVSKRDYVGKRPLLLTLGSFT
jgi:hypothetical protein